MKLKVVADFIKKTSIGELDKLPNRYIHTMYYLNYKQIQRDIQDPKAAEQRRMGEAVNEELGDML